MSISERWTRRQFLKGASSTTLTAALTTHLKAADRNTPGSRPPNILFIFPDEMRGQALG